MLNLKIYPKTDLLLRGYVLSWGEQLALQDELQDLTRRLEIAEIALNIQRDELRQLYEEREQNEE